MPKASATTPAAAKKASTSSSSSKKQFHVKIDCIKPVEDGILDLGSFEKYLHDNIKIEGKTGQLGDTVVVKRDATSITVTSTTALSKRYMKFLTKRFVTKSTLKEFIRVLADGKNGYKLIYFNVQAEDAGEGDEDEEDEDME